MSSVPPIDSDSNGSSESLSIERRSKVRFPLQLPVSYRTIGRGASCTGEGCVVNMSRRGILVSSRHEIGVGALMELNIEWPPLLYGRIPLRLVAVGKLVRCDAFSFAVVLGRHQFRTAKKKDVSFDESAAEPRY